MKITKYEHSCLDIKEDNNRIIIDPGKFSVSLKDFTNISALVITHVHSDHFLIDNIHKIIETNPNVKIFTVEQVAKEINHKNVVIVSAGQQQNIDDFQLKFFGGNHELYGGFENIGVIVNDTLYYPGDSYTVPDANVKILAVPASAPWLRVPDAVNFLQSCKPKQAFPMHNYVLSDAGEEIHYRILSSACREAGIDWCVLNVGESLEV